MIANTIRLAATGTAADHPCTVDAIVITPNATAAGVISLYDNPSAALVAIAAEAKLIMTITLPALATLGTVVHNIPIHCSNGLHIVFSGSNDPSAVTVVFKRA